ncbi:hypothetical protein BD408DRAFT_410788 [Parasitella parasitica]|nr:hypothetical protein BD408DRAFT_410788 [Parasitella parasitica]
MSLIKAFGTLRIQSRSYITTVDLHPKKFTSILANVPAKPRSAWQIYFCENMHNYKLPNGRIDMKKGNAAMGAAWKAMSAAEKKVYLDKFESEAKAHNDLLNEVLSKTTPKEFEKENALRRKYKLKTLRDPKRPKRGQSSFFLFVEHLRSINDPAVVGKDPMTQSAEASKKYKALGESEKKVFIDKAKTLREEYAKEMEKYHAKYDNPSM